MSLYSIVEELKINKAWLSKELGYPPHSFINKLKGIHGQYLTFSEEINISEFLLKYSDKLNKEISLYAQSRKDELISSSINIKNAMKTNKISLNSISVKEIRQATNIEKEAILKYLQYSYLLDVRSLPIAGTNFKDQVNDLIDTYNSSKTSYIAVEIDVNNLKVVTAYQFGFEKEKLSKNFHVTFLDSRYLLNELNHVIDISLNDIIHPVFEDNIHDTKDILLNSYLYKEGIKSIPEELFKKYIDDSLAVINTLKHKEMKSYVKKLTLKNIFSIENE